MVGIETIMPPYLTLSEITMKASSIREKIILPTTFCFALGLLFMAPLSNADQLYTDDLIIQGSLCVGLDCVNGENFNYDTIRLKENNVRIKFLDSSSTSSFPSNDWQITANDSANGGVNKFSIEDIDGGKVPFTVTAGAPNHSIFVKSNGYVGFNTSAPLVQMHVKDGNSPALRLEQDGSSGFTSQSWDIAGNETNFFIRDVTNGSNIPFKIAPGASKNSLYIASDGDVGLETQSPDGQFDVAHATDANNHAFLINPSSYVGVNIDNGFNPRGWFDVQTTGGVSRFMVQTDGKVGLGLGTAGAANGLFDVQVSGVSKFLVADDGDVAIGKSAVSGTNRLEVSDNSNSKDIMTLTNTGELALGTSSFPTYSLIEPTLMLQGKASTHHGIVLDTPTTNFTGSLIFAKNGTANWYLSSRNDFTNGNDRFVFFDRNLQEIISLEQGGKVGFGVLSVSAGNAIEHSNGAALTTGGAWTNGSSRATKNHVMELAFEDAFQALEALEPVTFEYNKEPGETYVGFIAEDAPELVATNNRKGIASMDVVAVLTKVVQNQNETIKQLNERLAKLEEKAN